MTPGIAAYVRVSTNEQTTSMQRETIERWLAARHATAVWYETSGSAG